MKKYILSLLLFSCICSLTAQEMYHRARVDLENKDLHVLAELGVEVDHGHLALGRYIENDFSVEEIQQIRAAGFDVKVLIENMGQYYVEQLSAGIQKITGDCFGDDVFSQYETPSNFTLGSMGGFYTYEEALAILDDMQDKFPDIISVKKQIGDIETHEGRPIYSVVISDNPETSEPDEPKNLYNAIHHAREPNGLTQLIFFMWHLLENYESDPLITEMINELELHFIPVVNPDGYIFNETTNPDGGGFWRKNRRDNGDGTFGVDLNRNYGYQWGINDTGSSPNTNAQTYRGPEPFSEPETQAVKLYCETYPFNFIFNYHTFGNLLIYPWGYNDSPTPENDYFQGIAQELTKLNNYTYGTGIETVGYNVNGDSDDWMYGEETTKQKSYAMTPEVGSEGFWPPMDAIIPNCQKNVQANLSLAAFNLNYPTIKIDAPIFVSDYDGLITYEVGQLGLNADEFTVTAEAITPNVSITENTSYNLLNLETQQKTVEFTIDSETPLGSEVVFVFTVSGDSPIPSDTVRFIYLENGETEAIVEEVFGDDLFWEADGIDWFYDEETFVSPAFSFSDSEGEYENNVDKTATSKSLTLPDAEQLMISFDLLMNTEANYDFVALYINPVDEAPTPLCGKYSKEGNNDQIPGLPLYDGQFGWVKEEIDITAWVGKEVTFQVRFVSDGFVNEDGFYMDDWNIIAINEVVSLEETGINSVAIYPNPATDILRIDMPYQDIDQLSVIDMLGRVVVSNQSQQNTISVQELPVGMYRALVTDVSGIRYQASFVKE